MRAHKTLADFQNAVSTFPISPFFPENLRSTKTLGELELRLTSPSVLTKSLSSRLSAWAPNRFQNELSKSTSTRIDDPRRISSRGGSIYCVWYCRGSVRSYSRSINKCFRYAYGRDPIRYPNPARWLRYRIELQSSPNRMRAALAQSRFAAPGRFIAMVMVVPLSLPRGSIASLGCLTVSRGRPICL